MTQFVYTITDPQGMHARPLSSLVRMAREIPCRITLSCGDRFSLATGIFSLMGMAVKCGEAVTVSIEGPEEENVCAQLQDFFKENY